MFILFYCGFWLVDSKLIFQGQFTVVAIPVPLPCKIGKQLNQTSKNKTVRIFYGLYSKLQ